MSVRVLVDAGPWLPVPPGGYGGIENVVSLLVPALRAQGAEVVLATIRGSTLEADDHLWTLDRAHLSEIAQPYNRSVGIAAAHMHAVARFLGDHRTGPGAVDVVHDHVEVLGPAVLAAMGDGCPPVLQTLHWDLARHADFYGSFDGRGRVGFAAVSQSQLGRAPANLRRQVLGVVPLGVAAAAGPRPRTEPPAGGPAVVLARITPDKGQDVAIRVGREAGVPVVLAGPVAGVDDPDELAGRLLDGRDPLQHHPDVAWFCREIAPHLDGRAVRWVGGVAGRAKEDLLAGACALLAPVQWAEPGATAVVEALARGVPVVATPHGAHAGLVRHGVTGFLAVDEHDLARHLTEVDTLDREECRRDARAWTPEAMAGHYLRLYDELVRRAR